MTKPVGLLIIPFSDAVHDLSVIRMKHQLFSAVKCRCRVKKHASREEIG